MDIILISCAAVLSLGGAFVMAELTARYCLRRFNRYYVWAPHARTRMELDPEALPALEREVNFEINEAGERGDPLPRDLSNVYRILVGGGSATEGYYIDQQSTWPHVAQRALNHPQSLKELGAERVHVGNIARSLAGSSQLCRIFARVLPRYDRLDAIVLWVGASDVIRWLERRTPETMEPEVTTPHLFAEHPEGPFGWSAKTLALRRVARRAYKRLFRPVEVRRRVGKRLAGCRAMRARATEILDRVPSPTAMLDRYEANLRRLIKLSRAHAERVVVVRSPWFDKPYTPEEEKLMWSFGAGRPHAEEVTTYYAHALVWKLMRQVNARTSTVCADLGVQHVDLMRVLDSDVETYYDELHHTPKGCAVIGNEIAKAILSRPDEIALPETLRAGSADVAPTPRAPEPSSVGAAR